MAFTATPSALSRITRTGSDRLNVGDYDLRHSTIYDKAVDDVMAELSAPELEGLFMMDNMPFDTESVSRKAYPGGQVPLNDDDDTIPLMQDSHGFPYTWGANYFRLGREWTQQTEDEDDTGMVAKSASFLSAAAQRTIRAARVDALDRGVDAATTQFLCSDGLCLIDGGRPNPDPNGGTWSNLEATGAITPDLLEDARLNALAVTAQNGDKLYLELDTIYIRPVYENDLLIALNSLGKVNSANNDINPEHGRGWNYKVIKELEANNIFYSVKQPMMGDELGLRFRWRVAPNVKPTWVERNPDIKGVRIRMAFTIGCMDPRASLRGGPLTAK